MLISILIVSNNNKKDLEILLPSLEKGLSYLYQEFQNNNKDNCSKKPQCEILLVDNCSSDLTVDFVKNNYPYVKITNNKRKTGYGANQNQNIAKAKGEFLLMLNPDMVVPDHLFYTMVRFMQSYKDAGIATCKICNKDGSCQYLNKREPAIIDLFLRRFFPKVRQQEFLLKSHLIDRQFIYNLPLYLLEFLKLSHIVKKRLDLYEMRDTGYDKVIDVPFISGSFMFARASVIKQNNGFDERFFMYFEDVDLCRRVRSTARLLYCPEVSVIHRWERASYKSLKWAFVFALSGLKYFNKWGFRFI